MNKLEIKLKQHTPLIHFQHDQEGATLRASEVKPKLDKYIMSKLSSEEKENGRNEGWIKSKGDKVWLDYRMKIKAKGEPKEFLIASLLSPTRIFDENHEEIRKSDLPFKILGSTPFFAQENINSSNKQEDSPVFLKRKNEQGQYDYIYNENTWESIDKKGVMWDELEITILSTYDKLLKNIDNTIAEFFTCTNFGTRSNKGFGSFTRDNDTRVLEHLKSNYKFVYGKKCQGDNLNTIFRKIKEDYQKLKSGINHNGYTKSILFCYAVKEMENNPRWEKRFFKKAAKDRMGYNKRLLDKEHAPITDADGNMSWNDPQKYDYRYLRAVLGLAEQYEFLLEFSKDGKWKRDNREKLVVRPKSRDKEIERYKSPLLIKVIDDTIYIVGEEVNNKILGKEFSVNYSIGQRELPVSDEYKRLVTPESFCLSEFMNFAMSPEFKLGYKKEK